MKSDPRACKIPVTEFNHLSCAEIRELDRLERMGRRNHRWEELIARRVFPDRGHNNGDAA